MQAHLSKNSSLNNSQYGFRRGRGTENALHFDVEFMHPFFDENKFAMGIFLDVKKTFPSSHLEGKKFLYGRFFREEKPS